MEHLAFEDGRLTALAAGGILAAAGLGLIVWRRAGRGLAGVAVLLAGAGLLALAAFARHPPPAAKPSAPPPVAMPGVTVSGDRTVAAPAAGPPPPLPGREVARVSIEAAEAEPNDTLAAANRAPLGATVLGGVSAGDLDFFAVDVPAKARGDIAANLLVLTGDASLTLFDDTGQVLGSMPTHQQVGVRSTGLSRHLDAGRYYVMVRGEPPGAAASYQLTIATRRF